MAGTPDTGYARRTTIQASCAKQGLTPPTPGPPIKKIRLAHPPNAATYHVATDIVGHVAARTTMNTQMHSIMCSCSGVFPNIGSPGKATLHPHNLPNIHGAIALGRC